MSKKKPKRVERSLDEVLAAEAWKRADAWATSTTGAKYGAMEEETR
jgi:hypothetical protein